MRLFEFADGTTIDLLKIATVSPLRGRQPEDQTYAIYMQAAPEITVWHTRKYFGDQLNCQASREGLIAAWANAMGLFE